MKIDAKILRDFVEKISLKGGMKNIPEIELVLTANGIESRTKDVGNSNMILALLKKEAFEGYDVVETQRIGIKDTELLLKLLSTFVGSIELKVTPNLLVLSDKNKVASLTLMKPEFIVNNKFPEEVPLFDKFDGGVQFSSEIFKNSVKNLNTLGADNITLSIKDNVLEISAGDKGFNNITERIDCNYKNVTASYGNAFKRAVDLLPEGVNFAIMADNAPIQFTISTESYLIKIVASPYGGKEEKPTSQEVQGVIVGEL